MAKAIITCTGETINIGDKVKTPDGRIIKVEGAAIGVSFHDAEKCQVVGHDVKTTKELEESGEGSVETKAVRRTSSDCIIWGT